MENRTSVVFTCIDKYLYCTEVQSMQFYSYIRYENPSHLSFFARWGRDLFLKESHKASRHAGQFLSFEIQPLLAVVYTSSCSFTTGTICVTSHCNPRNAWPPNVDLPMIGFCEMSIPYVGRTKEAISSEMK